MSDVKLRDSFASVIVPVTDGAGYISDVVDRVVDCLRTSFYDYEVVIIDNGSTDNTKVVLDEVLRKHSGIRMFSLPRAHRSTVAVAVGLDAAVGDYVVVMDPQTDPAQLVLAVIERAETGIDIIYGVDKSHPRYCGLSGKCADCFHWYLERCLKLDFPRHATLLRCFTRRAVLALSQVSDHPSQYRVLGSILGFRCEQYEYEMRLLGRGSTPSIYEAVAEGIELITANSPHPLRAVTLFGCGLALSNLLYMCYVAAIYLLKPDVTQGWTTLSMQISLLFMAIFLVLLAMSEYTGQILKKLQERPLYFVADEKVSAVMIPRERINVVSDAAQTLERQP